MNPPTRAPDPDENSPYHVEPVGNGYAVVDHQDRAIVQCGTAANAEHYAALLNESYRRGYKAGFRNGRR
jgi:hypothetical protein